MTGITGLGNGLTLCHHLKQYWFSSMMHMYHQAAVNQHIEAETKWPPFCRWHFQMHFLEWKCMKFNKISHKFVSKGPITNIPTLVQIMAWRQPGNKPLSEPMLVSLLMHTYVAWPQCVNIKHSEENLAITTIVVFFFFFLLCESSLLLLTITSKRFYYEIQSPQDLTQCPTSWYSH